MRIIWLGQGGLLFVSGKTKIMLDPYLSDSLSKYSHEFARKIKLNKKLFKVKPDALIITNSHSDHADVETIEKLIKRKKKKTKLTILSCENVFKELIEIPTVCQANHIMLERDSEWTVDTINIRAVPAKTDDKSAFGVIITDTLTNEGYYVAGDTLYNKNVIDSIPNKLYAAFLPINGEYGSMNLIDAKRFASQIDAKYFVPVHFGMFDNIDPKGFDLPNTIIPSPFKVIDFEAFDNKAIRERLDFKFNEKEDKTQKLFRQLQAEAENEDEAENDSTVIEAENKAITNKDVGESIVHNEITEATEETKALSSDNVDSIDEKHNIQASEAVDIQNDNEDNVPSEDDIPFEAGDWEEYVKADEVGDAEALNDDTLDDDLDKFIDDENEAESTVEISYPNASNDDSDKIDAYIKEIEKFERGEATDFSKID